MGPDRTILHLVKKISQTPPPLKNYAVHTIKPQLRPCSSFCSTSDTCRVTVKRHEHHLI